MKNKKHVWKALTVLQEDKETEWLSEMSSEGWHLVNYIPFRYTFEKGEPKEYVYKFDYHTKIEDKKMYIQIFEDAGWEYILNYLGWQLFRCDPDNVTVPELFTDDASKIVKYKKLLRMLVSVFIMILLISVGIVFNPHNTQHGRLPLQIIYGIMIIFYVYFIIGLYLRIKTIKEMAYK